MALKILSWMVRHLRPLSLNEIREALAVEHSTTKVNSDAFIHQDDMLEMTLGLLTIDENESLFLAHEIVHGFLSARLHDINHFDSVIAKTCLRYLNFETFYQQTTNFGRSTVHIYDNEYDYRVKQHPFLPYAARYWADHYLRSEKSEELTDMGLKLITSLNAPAMLQAYSKNKIIRMDGLNPFHIAALLGIPPLLEILITQATREARQSNQPGFFESLIDSRNAFGNTPLLYAIMQRQFAVAKMLLQTNAVNPSIMENTIIRWTLGWGNEELIRLMVRMPKFNK